MSCLSSPRSSCALKLPSTQRPQSSITCCRYVSLSERSFSLLCTCSSMVHRVRSYAAVVLQCHPHLQTWLCNVLSLCTVQLTCQYTLHLDNWFTWSISLLLRRTHQDWCTDRPVCAFQITSQSRTMPILPGSRTPRAAHPCLPVLITGWTLASFSSTLTT